MCGKILFFGLSTVKKLCGIFLPALIYLFLIKVLRLSRN